MGKIGAYTPEFKTAVSSALDQMPMSSEELKAALTDGRITDEDRHWANTVIDQALNRITGDDAELTPQERAWGFKNTARKHGPGDRSPEALENLRQAKALYTALQAEHDELKGPEPTKSGPLESLFEGLERLMFPHGMH